jgi:hypothetical protein
VNRGVREGVKLDVTVHLMLIFNVLTDAWVIVNLSSCFFVDSFSFSSHVLKKRDIKTNYLIRLRASSVSSSF